MSTPTSAGRLQHRFTAGLAELPLACFGVVMATGIISISAHLLALPRIARALFHLNLLLYATLWLLTILRAARWPMRMVGDLVDHLRAPGAFTTVAGTSVVGSQFVLLYAGHSGGFLFWFAALALWLILTYVIFALLTLKQDKPTLESGINGSWLLAVVATQSIVTLGALLAPHASAIWQGELFFVILAMWLSSGMLYIWIMGLIIYRYLFFRLDAAELSPSYWINMGAMAISTLAGCLLIANAGNSLFPHTMLPFIEGLTLFYWATGTWWIPMLLLLGIWRYGYRRYPLRYVAAYWSAVFPLGMYAACTEQLASVMHFEFLLPLARVFLYLALFAWTLTSVGLLHHLWQRLAARAPQATPG
ncbi:MAG TPA: tellurite resistance/C4-dicarboxylate transporter family protein [Methylophilaceae bacterium]|nr:tellurite resistance/C4-dicarboxylate transporter family protein [Methylophilaceae bacterium]